jgi:hypothetical protein
MMWPLFAVQLLTTSDVQNNPVRLHHLCVQRAVDRFVRSGEPANTVAEAALTKCDKEFGSAVDWMASLTAPPNSDAGTLAFARRTARETLLEQERKDAIHRAVEQKSNRGAAK